MQHWEEMSDADLARLPPLLRSDPRFDGLARYCELRSQGLRQQAFGALDEFLLAARGWPLNQRSAAVVRILVLSKEHPMAQGFIPTPLLRGFIVPCLEEWLEADPSSRLALRWIALVRSDQELLARALEGDPADDDVRLAMVSDLLSGVDYSTHHIESGSLVRDVATTLRELESAENLIAHAPDPDAMEAVSSRAAGLRQLVDTWLERKLPGTSAQG